jgi:hypothetical protein
VTYRSYGMSGNAVHLVPSRHSQAAAPAKGRRLTQWILRVVTATTAGVALLDLFLLLSSAHH